jgi:chromosome segregation protein
VRLKRLEIQGFKTFATRTLLEFDHGITAIVGPNGSGKSNIADAVRWVLGEQSLRALRSRKSEDVIFAGSKRRPPVGMAEVHLTLDNHDGLLPLDFAEVTITRRLYRSGESEYLLNRSRVRLRDIQDLLARADIGQNSHTVIGQGMVDHALALRPEERRLLLEEAAGIRQYYARRDEAEARLAETEANTTRVCDLLAELEPRVEALRQQAERARRAAELKASIRDLSAELYLQQYVQLQSQLAAIQEQLSAAEDEAVRLRDGAAGAAARAAALGAERDTWHGALEQARTALDEAREAARRAAHELALRRERLAAVEQERARLTSELARLSARAAAATKELAEARAALEEVDSPNTAVALSALEEAAAQAAAAVQDLEQQCARLRDDAAAAQAQVAQAQRAAADARAQLTSLQQELDTAVPRSPADEACALEARGRELRARLAELTAEMHRVEQERREWTARQAEAGSRVAELERAVREREQLLTRLSARLQALKELQNTREDLERGAQVLLSQMSPVQAAGVLGDFLVVPPELQRAAGAALGPALQAVLVRSRRDASAALRFISSTGGSHVTLLPLDGPAPPPAHPALAELPGVLGWLDQLVTVHPSAPEPAARAIQGLLRRVLVVEGLEDAWRASDVLRTQNREGIDGLVIVTLPGERIELTGLARGGTSAASSLLERQRECAELAARVAELRQTVQVQRRRLSEARREQAGHQEQARRLHERLQRLAASRREVEQQLGRLEHELAALRREAEWLQIHMARTRERIQGLQQRAASLDAEAAQAAAEQERALRALRDLAPRLDAARARRDSAQEVLQEARARAALARQRRAAAERLVRTLEGQLAGLVADRSRATERLEAGTAGAARLRAEIDEWTRRLAEAEEARHRAQAGLEAAQHAAAQAAAAAAAADQEVQQQRASLAEAERRVARLAAEQQRLAVRADALREQALHELGVDIAAGSVRNQGAWVSIDEPIEALRGTLEKARRQLHALGPVNDLAIQEFEREAERCRLLREQIEDLRRSAEALREVRAELEQAIRREFDRTLARVAEEFKRYVAMLFRGGTASLSLTRPDAPEQSGIEVTVQLPGRRRQDLAALSGGERALVGVALLFAILRARPAPFCVLDEVDAALDEANVARFCEALQELSAQTQFIVITHNRRTMERAGALYGVSMSDDSVSQVLSLRLRDVQPRDAAPGQKLPAP